MTGVGQAALKADGSNRATAQQKALAAALADARAQAGEVAQVAGVTISGVLSVSVSTGNTYAVPMMVGAGSAPGATPSGGTGIAPAPGETVTQQLEVSVTVAYRIG